jgi:hypothetical protein
MEPWEGDPNARDQPVSALWAQANAAREKGMAQQSEAVVHRMEAQELRWRLAELRRNFQVLCAGQSTETGGSGSGDARETR